MTKLSRRLALTLGFVAAVSAAGIAITQADPPGDLFMDFDNNSAALVHPPHDQAKARISRPVAKLDDDVAAAIAAGAQPVGSSIILAYRGQLYIIPDKQLEGGKMVSQMVMGAAARASN
jgi:hypothetical protein